MCHSLTPNGNGRSYRKRTILLRGFLHGYSARRLIREFSDKNWKRRGIKNLSRNVHETGLLDLLAGSSRPRISRSCVVHHHLFGTLNMVHEVQLVNNNMTEQLNSDPRTLKSLFSL